MMYRSVSARVCMCRTYLQRAFLLLFWDRVYVALHGQELTMKIRLALNSRRFTCLSLPSAGSGLKDMSHHFQLLTEFWWTNKIYPHLIRRKDWGGGCRSYCLILYFRKQYTALGHAERIKGLLIWIEVRREFRPELQRLLYKKPDSKYFRFCEPFTVFIP